MLPTLGGIATEQQAAVELPATGGAAPVPATDALEAMRGGRRGWVVRRFLLVADIVGLTFAFMAANHVFPPHEVAGRIGPSNEMILFLATLPLWAVLFMANGLYHGDEDRTNHSTADDLTGLLHAVTIGVFMTRLVGWLTHLFDPTPPKLFTFWALAIVSVAVLRAVARIIVRRLPAFVQRTVIVGAGDLGRRLATKLRQHPEYRIQVVGFVDRPFKAEPTADGPAILGPVEELETIVHEKRIDRVIVAFPDDGSLVPPGVVRALADDDVRVDVVPRFFDVFGLAGHAVEGVPLVPLPRLRLSRSATLAKRTSDVVLASLALVVLSPVLLAIAAAIVLDSRGPALFRQTRMGRDGRPFRIFKFRTMTVDADAHKHEVATLNKHACDGGDPRMFKVRNDPRTTRAGGFLRRWSLDELPQLLNVLRGDMSLVGPRPLIPEEDVHMVDWRRWRLHVKPGMTGIWQVLGRDDISLEEMAVLDYRYVTGWSLFGDVQLMLRTLPALVRPRGAY
jgi:exopolysaccharide biosynthesis polyprenyl glycosylphosphotransferase